MKIYIGTLDRFGYDLTAAAKTETEVRAAIMKEYIKAYFDINGGEDPTTEPSDREEGNTMYEKALEDIEVLELTLEKVEWR